MNALNFKNHFNENLAKEIIFQGKYAYRRDMLRIVRVKLEKEFQEKETYAYEKDKEVLKYEDGILSAGNESQTIPLEKKENSKFDFWKVFEREEDFAIRVLAEDLFSIISIQSRMLRAISANMYQASFIFDMKENKMETWDKEMKEGRQKGLKIIQKKATIKEERYIAPFAIVEDFVKSIIEDGGQIEIYFYHDKENKKFLRMINELNKEIAFPVK